MDSVRTESARAASVLRPRDIQARIRAGETPDDVAQAAQTSVERIMPFAAPVLAERAHVVQRAQRSSLRRTSSEHHGARTLGDAVAARLRGQDADPDGVEWDAWRRPDGRWTLTASYAAGPRTGTGRFSFDAPGSYVTIENDEARWLVGDARPAPGGHEDPRVVLAEELPLGHDALQLVSELPPLAEVGRQSGPRPDADPGADADLGPDRDRDPNRDRDQESTVDLTATAARVRGESTPQARRPARRGRGRASVPSWDEIMFGGGTQD